MALRGLDQVRRNADKLLRRELIDKAEKAMHVATSIVAGYASLETPVDTSNLINSQYRSVRKSNLRVVGVIGYTAAYAAAVHDAKGTLSGQPRPSGRGSYWAPNGEPGFLVRAGDDHKHEIDRAVEKAMTL